MNPQHPDRADDERFLTAAELAERWGVTRATIYNLMARGLPSVSIGRCRRFIRGDADAWLASNEGH